MAVLRVIEAFGVSVAGRLEVYNPGRLVDDTDPVVKGREAFFGPEDAAARVVRLEPSAPAPSRRRGRPAKRAASKRASKKAAPDQKVAEGSPRASDSTSSEVL